MEIRPTKALYVKLGREGGWEKESLLDKQVIHFGYREVSHDDCQAGKWDKVAKQLADTIRRGRDRGTITRDVKQIRAFYESDEKVLWATFYGDKLYWCFSKPVIAILADNSKTRPVVGRWRSTDANDRPLTTDKLRGSLLSVQGFRSTICAIDRDFDYLVDRINGKISQSAEKARQAQEELVDRLEALIRGLSWKDFETLVDLIYRAAGWQRLGRLGGNQKTVDLELWSPITEERIAVQVKSKADAATFTDYKDRFSGMTEVARSFFVVHSPSDDLLAVKSGDDGPTIWGPRRVASMCMSYGLSQWVLDKAG